MKSIEKIMLLVVLAVFSSSTAAMPLECELMKQDILAQASAQRENPCERDYVLCMASGKSGCAMQRNYCESGRSAGKALGALAGTGSEDQLQEKIQQYKAMCE